MRFSLFRKPKPQQEPEKTAVPSEENKEEVVAAPEEAKVEEPKQETTAPQPEPAAEQAAPKETVVPAPEQKQETIEPISKTYLKAMPLKELSDIDNVKEEVRNGNIIILRVTPLANKSIDDVKNAVNSLYEFAESIGGDIARLGEERVVICPKNIRIWREKTPASTVSNEPLPTAA
jgi:SepF-like predicted cell division protein (DUF552 family)